MTKHSGMVVAMLIAVFLMGLLALAGCGGSNPAASGGGGATAPSAPTGVTATAGGASNNTLSWTAVTGATSYNIYWSTTTGVTKTNGTKITGATSPYNHTGLTPNGPTYYYVVTAVNANGESAESAQASAVPTT